MRGGTRRTLQRAVMRRLTQTCEIRRYAAPTPDGYGGYSQPTDYEYFTYPCYLTLERRTPRESGTAGADIGQVFYMLQLPYDANIADGDVVIVDGKEYEVSQAIVEHSNDVMRQARLVKAGS